MSTASPITLCVAPAASPRQSAETSPTMSTHRGVDPEAIEAALVKGYSAASDICDLLDEAWRRIVAMRAAIYFDRVPTDGNIGDAPSRGFCKELDERGAVRVVCQRAVEGLGDTARRRGLA